ncbi:MAG: S46 family peptidase [Flavobacteriales bacterium]|nr:S46 family peptidase [Flavobacteriales bacterium]
MKSFIFIVAAFFISLPLLADEGMWLPHLLKLVNEEDMQAKGLKITAEDIYSINQSSLKDAIVSLNGGSCTAEMISPEGLMLTNHHCAYDVIQTHSSVTNDYIKDGFWAMSNSEELKNDNLSATFLISIENETDRFTKALNDNMTETQRGEKISEISKTIVEEQADSTTHTARVKSFFGGNDFYLLVFETFKDVRLVGAPPSSIGNFGGDTDNWMWPRHTGDFSLLRVYTAPDGSPARYAIENIPYKPKHHLPVQLDGVENEDYTMIMGYPGRTKRYLTSFGVKEALELTNSAIVNIRSKKLDIMKAGMNADEKVKIQYASKYAKTSNYWKYYIGQSKGLKRMNVYKKKLSIEDEFTSWIKRSDSLVQEKYTSVLGNIETAYLDNKRIAVNRIYLNEAIFQGSEIMSFAYTMQNRIKSLPKDKKEKAIALKKLKKIAKEFYKDYNPEVDQELFSAMLEGYYYNVPKSQHAPVFKKIENQLFGFKKLDFDYYAKMVFRKSFFSSSDRCLDFLKNPTKNLVNRDPAYTTMNSIYNKYLEDVYPKRKEIRDIMKKENRLFIQGLREMDTSKKYYPDANSTMRLTYGNVGDYKPGEAIVYDYFTTIRGVIEKEDATNDEFVVHPRLKELYAIGDYGKYADSNGMLRVNFISNNDITGGNSGSPVINAWGEIIGTAFDGNWEAMSGDITFESQIQRTISVDIRYILFIIDKFAGASYLLEEMTIAQSRKNKEVKVVTENLE